MLVTYGHYCLERWGFSARSRCMIVLCLATFSASVKHYSSENWHIQVLHSCSSSQDTQDQSMCCQWQQRLLPVCPSSEPCWCCTCAALDRLSETLRMLSICLDRGGYLCMVWSGSLPQVRAAVAYGTW